MCSVLYETIYIYIYIYEKITTDNKWFSHITQEIFLLIILNSRKKIQEIYFGYYKIHHKASVYNEFAKTKNTNCTKVSKHTHPEIKLSAKIHKI